MQTVVSLLLALLVPATAWAPMPRALNRRACISMSHFSCVKTELKDKELLLSSLQDIGVSVKVAEKELIPVKGYKGLTTDAEMAITQENGHDIGFRYNGQAYEMVADLDFWGQTVPVDAFLEKLTQRYSVNAVRILI